MEFIQKSLFGVIVTLLSLFTVPGYAQVSASQPSSAPIFAKMKEYRFPSGVCSQLQSAGLPDMVTYMTTTATFVTASHIETCLYGLEKAKWTVMQFDPPPVVNTLREARTDNMACTQIGFVQAPVMYMVKFSSYNLTGKQGELEQCLLGMYRAKDLVQSMSMNQHL